MRYDLHFGGCALWRMAEGVGFEPTRPFWGLTVFKTAGFNRSPTPPVFRFYHLRPAAVAAVAHSLPISFSKRCIAATESALQDFT